MRIGLRYLKGLGRGDFARVEAARKEAPFASVEELAVRTGLDQGALATLAEAGALEALAPPRREALWQALGTARERRGHLVVREREKPDPLPVAVREETADFRRERTTDFGRPAPLPLEEREGPVGFRKLNAFQTVLWDYQTQGHSVRSHPLAALREELRTLGLPTAQEVVKAGNGRPMRYAGLVICRQQPGTAKGVTFLTLEDETGFVNVVVWQQVFARYTALLRTAAFLGVTGTMQVEGEVVHLVARTIWTPEVRLHGAHAPSRDFQ